MLLYCYDAAFCVGNITCLHICYRFTIITIIKIDYFGFNLFYILKLKP